MAQNILSNISSLVFRFHRRQPLAVVRNEDNNHIFTPNEINQLGLNLQNLQNITTGVFELGRPGGGFAGAGGVCPEAGNSRQLSVRNNCLDCVKKNFLDCVFNHGPPVRRNIYRTLLGAGNPTGVNSQYNPARNDIFINCPGWQAIPDLLNISQQVVATDNQNGNPWIVECHFHVFLPDIVGNVEVGQSNKVELTLRFRRDGAKIRLREMAERKKIKSDAGESKEKDDTASGTETLSWRNAPPKGYKQQNKRTGRRQGNRRRWGGKKTRKNKSRQSMKKKSRKSRKSMKKKSRKSRKSMKKKI